ncbi:hypothetical protein AOLI_G00135970 [Acnodon oligacanthus]
MENNNGYEQEEDMLQEDEWDRDLLLDPAWEKQQRKNNRTSAQTNTFPTVPFQPCVQYDD